MELSENIDTYIDNKVVEILKRRVLLRRSEYSVPAHENQMTFRPHTTDIRMPSLFTTERYIPAQTRNRNILDSRTDTQPPKECYTPETLVLWTGTWNVSAPKKPFEIKDIVHVDNDQHNIGMYAIALQEVTDPGAASVTIGSTSNAKAWGAALDAYMINTKNLCKLAVESIGGTMLAVYVDKLYARYISDISVSTIALGPWRVAKNKGAVGIRFKLGLETFCIVSAHLAAGETNNEHTSMLRYTPYERRIQDYESIKNNMSFKMDLANTHGSQKKMFSNRHRRTMRMMDHSNIVFMGDLNFRITPNESLNTLKMLENKGFHYPYPFILEKLREYDELLYAMTYHRVLQGFQEGLLTFKPTYKYDANMDIYDAKTVRMPAWTDRILWKGEKTELLQYNTKHTIGSDHKPLHAIIVFNNVLGPSLLGN
jgi:endonuclease/exonuclease/phosphatase family metal-dependent hydrolase